MRNTVCVILLTTSLLTNIVTVVTAQDPLQRWEKETDLQTRFSLACQIVSQWPGSQAAEKVAGTSFSDKRYTEEQLFQIAQSYYEGLDQTSQSGKYKELALKLMGAPPGTTQILPAPMNGLQDSGSFTIYTGDKQVGRVQFNWALSGSYNSLWEQTQNGIKNSGTTKIDVDEIGLWTKITNTTPMGDAVIERVGSILHVKYPSGPPSKSTILPNTVIINLNTDPALLALAARQYDPAKGGNQQISVMMTLFPGASRASIERKNVFTIPGTSDSFTKYALSMYPFPASFWVDSKGRVVLVELPALGPNGPRAFVRPGAEELIGH